MVNLLSPGFFKALYSVDFILFCLLILQVGFVEDIFVLLPGAA